MSDPGLILIGILTLNLILNNEILLGRQGGRHIRGVIVHRIVVHQHLSRLLNWQVLSIRNITLGSITALACFVTRVRVRTRHHPFLLLLQPTYVVLLIQTSCIGFR